MKNRELLELNNGLQRLRKDLPGRVFNHAVVLNKQKISPLISALNAAKKPSEKMNEYLQKFEELKKEYAKKDEKGNPVIRQGIDPMTGANTFFYDIPDNEDPHSEFVQKRNTLYEEYKEVIDAHTKVLQEWSEELLDKESEFQPTFINLSDVPDDIHTDEMEGIIYIINGEE